MIVTSRIYPSAVECSGLGFIGDPHLDSRRPGRRKDRDYASAILAKVEFCIRRCNERRLFPIFLGDVYNAPVIVDESVKTRLTRILKESWAVPISILGNHETLNERISDADSIATLATSDVVDLVVTTTPVCEFLVGSRRFGVGATPYGEAIPVDVSGAFPEAHRTIWLTHHDIAFDGAYPNALPPFVIAGCDLVVNGHQHGTKTPVVAGTTTWFNPGNITRQSIDHVDHEPRMWILGENLELDSIVVPHEKDVFDATGRLVRAADGREVVRDATQSRFVQLLAKETTLDMEKSQDGSLLREEIEALFEAEKTPAPERAIVLSLFAEAVARHSGAD